MTEKEKKQRQQKRAERQERLAVVAFCAVVFTLLVLAPIVLCFGDVGVFIGLALLSMSVLPLVAGAVFDFLAWIFAPPSNLK